MMIVQTLADLVKRLGVNPDDKDAIEKIKLIGEGVAFGGGYAALVQLHDAAVKLVGDDSISRRLDELWDGRDVSKNNGKKGGRG